MGLKPLGLVVSCTTRVHILVHEAYTKTSLHYQSLQEVTHKRVPLIFEKTNSEHMLLFSTFDTTSQNSSHDIKETIRVWILYCCLKANI